MVHVGERCTFISLFITLEPVGMMRRAENLTHSFSKQLQAAAPVTITHQEIWISKSSVVGKADCPTNKHS